MGFSYYRFFSPVARLKVQAIVAWNSALLDMSVSIVLDSSCGTGYAGSGSSGAGSQSSNTVSNTGTQGGVPTTPGASTSGNTSPASGGVNAGQSLPPPGTGSSTNGATPAGTKFKVLLCQ